MLRKSFERDWLVKKLLTMAVLATALASGAPANAAKVIAVSDVEQLYTEVNNPANTGAIIKLSAGVYPLSATNMNGTLRTNGGRLDLQLDMSLVGVEGNREAVLIAPAALPASSFAFPPVGRTGVIRIGRGYNDIEWLSIAGNTAAAAAISTDLVQLDMFCGDGVQPGACPTTIRVAHVAATGSTRGVDVRNVTERMKGRRIVAEIMDSDFYWGHEGIRMANFIGADNAEVRVQMSSNHCYQNPLGCIVENNRTTNATIAVQSLGDVFDDNGLGCMIGGGLVGTGSANWNTTKFDAYESVFANNTRTNFNTAVSGPEFDEGGVVVVGATVLAGGTPPYSTSGNAVIAWLWDCQIVENRLDGREDFELEVLGARSQVPISDDLSITDNHALVQLRGTTAGVEAVVIDRQPPDLDASNKATLVRIPAHHAKPRQHQPPGSR